MCIMYTDLSMILRCQDKNQLFYFFPTAVLQLYKLHFACYGSVIFREWLRAISVTEQ